MKYAQYGEEAHIRKFFYSKENGVCVDVGAADGIRYSNSRMLIQELGWKGILVEPNINFYNSLENLYSNADGIHLMNNAVYNKIGVMPFYEFGDSEHAQVSTLSKEFKKRVEAKHSDLGKYKDPVDIDVITLETVLSKAMAIFGNVDFLSVDCEGVDMEVIQSNNWNRYRPRLVCVEHSMPKDELNKFMESNRYEFLLSTIGNSFYKNKEI